MNVLLGNSITDPNDPQGTIPDGTFASADHHPLEAKTPIRIVSGFQDFNDDGFDDLAVANSDTGIVSMLFGDGDGGFQTPYDYSFGSGLTTAASGNFTQSGHTDLAAAVDSNVKIMLGNGNQNFQLPPLSFPIGSTNQGALVVADLNADSKPDIVVSDVTGVMVLLSGTGDTTAPKAALTAPLAGITTPTVKPYTFSVKFTDTNGNKLRDRVLNVLEAGLANWRIYIDANHNGVFDAGETSTLTDAGGNWSFKTLTARTAAYIVRIVPQARWTRTTPTTGTPAGSFSIVLANSGVSKTGLLFGEKPAPL